MEAPGWMGAAFVAVGLLVFLFSVRVRSKRSQA